MILQIAKIATSTIFILSIVIAGCLERKRKGITTEGKRILPAAIL